MHFQRVDEPTICSEIAQTRLDVTPSIELMKQELFLTIPLKQPVFWPFKSWSDTDLRL